MLNFNPLKRMQEIKKNSDYTKLDGIVDQNAHGTYWLGGAEEVPILEFNLDGSDKLYRFQGRANICQGQNIEFYVKKRFEQNVILITAYSKDRKESNYLNQIICRDTHNGEGRRLISE